VNIQILRQIIDLGYAGFSYAHDSGLSAYAAEFARLDRSCRESCNPYGEAQQWISELFI